ncbi:DUF397 domain-containing protein (plasmid) [Streptomyces sp. SDT5-1]|uniref:DUF397 domain-containing protein n=1 Tax=Streptomyces sp. SDT5-1 TaxID=3406418 RepID=UPI003FD3291A
MTAHPRFDPATAVWFKASYSSGDQNCLESALVPGVVPVRDSKLAEESPVVLFSPTSWSSFITELKSGN